jgi:hypothetical protein
MTCWFFILGLPVLLAGLALTCRTKAAARALVAFPRHVLAGQLLCAVAWAWTAYECHTIGIDVFDKFLKAFPFELPILAVVLTVLTCWWMPNLLPVRALCGLFMLFPGELFPVIRLCETPWRLTLVVFAYLCAIIGMYGMFYPWKIRQGLAWLAERPKPLRVLGGALTGLGILFCALGGAAAFGLIA